jgi:3-methyl-2-oxobutanoate hydroxymethyltransferase
VQVWHDVLGLYPTAPRHARRFGEIGNAIETALRAYVQEVQAGTFPTQPAKPPVPAKPVSVI